MVGIYFLMGSAAIWKFPILGWDSFLSVNHVGQKFSRFIGELQRHSLDIHLCLFYFLNVSAKWYPLFFFSAAVTMDVSSTFWLNENVVSGICSFSLKTEFFSCMYFKFFAKKEPLERCKQYFWQVTAFPLASHNDLHENSKQTSTFA